MGIIVSVVATGKKFFILKGADIVTPCFRLGSAALRYNFLVRNVMNLASYSNCGVV